MTPYPLAWPETMPRYKASRQAGQFKTTLAGAIKNVQDSLRRFASDSGKPLGDVVISSNVTLGVNSPQDPGVSVWFTWDGLSVCIPVDRYSKVEANLQAIHHIIEARRTELRHGTLALVRATFTGFAALPGPTRKKTWREVFGVDGTFAPAESLIQQRYRALAKERAANEGLLKELNVARDDALTEIKGGR